MRPLGALAPLVGEDATEVGLPAQDEVGRGRTTFEWLEGGGYLIQRAPMERPGAFRALSWSVRAAIVTKAGYDASA